MVAGTDDEGPDTLSKQTYRLVGLTGALGKYNDLVTRVYRAERSGFRRVEISENMCIELPQRFLLKLSEFEVPVVEESAWQITMQNAENSLGATANNRGSLKQTIDNLVHQLRSILLKNMQGMGRRGAIDSKAWAQGIRRLFDDMDSNHNGLLDKKVSEPRHSPSPRTAIVKTGASTGTHSHS